MNNNQIILIGILLLALIILLVKGNAMGNIMNPSYTIVTNGTCKSNGF